MIRYKSNKNLKMQFEQNQLISVKVPELTTKAILRPKIQTTLKRNIAYSTNIARTKLRLKRKVLVYKKDNKFYIDHSTAYALKLTNVRAIMTENPHLVEVGLETLKKFQNREDIEIEYKEINKEKRITTRNRDLSDILEELKQGEYGIGIHGIDKGSNEEKQSTATDICMQGLSINNNSKTILSTAVSLGMNENLSKINQDIKGYNFGKGTKTNVIIAVPIYIQNQKGEKIFLGFPSENKRTSGQQYEEHCILDRICAKLNRIPSEFILGYYSQESSGSENFIENLKHYSNISQKEREDLYKEIYLNMDDVSKSYNELITNGNISKLDKMKERMQQLGLNLYMVENSITIVKKYKEQIKNKDIEEKKGRKVILDDVQKSEVLSDSTKIIRTRKILLNFCKGAKLSDLSNAKEILREGSRMQTQENYRGKEV